MAGSTQRDRILTAMSHAVAEHGYASATVAEIVARAEVSKNTFYRHFDGKRECFLATFDAITANYLAAFATAYRTGSDTSDGTAAGLRAVFEVVAADPGALRVVTVEASGVGAEGIARREQLITGFEEFLRTSLGLAPRSGTIANPILRAIVGGLVRVLYSQVQRGSQSNLPELVDDLETWATSYYASPAIFAFRDPKPTRPGAFDGLWGGRAPGTLARGSPGPATQAQGVSSSFLVHRQRERILDAVAALTAQHGYSALTVEGIVQQSGVSMATFHQQFAGREEAFLVAYEVGHAKGMAIVERAFFAETDWQAGVRAGISALFDFLASEPSFARMALVDALAATRRSAVRSRRGANAYAQMLLPGARQTSSNPPQGAITIDAIAGGVFELCLSYSLKGRIAELSELAPRATYFVLTPFIGADAAAQIAIAPQAERPRA